MNLTLPATELKKLVKKLAAVQSDFITLGNNYASAADGDTGVSVFNSSFYDTPISINSRLFSSTCNKLTKDVILFYDSGPLIIKSNKFKAELPVFHDKATPIPVSSLSELEIDAGYFSSLLNYVSQVTNEKVTYDHTGSIQILADQLGLVLTGTDNLRVAIVSDTVKHSPFDPILVPAKVTRIIKELEGMINISQSDSSIFFQSGDTTIYTRKSSKKFPNIGKVIPQSYKLVVDINTQEFLETLNRVSPTIDPETDSKVLLSFKDDVLQLQSGNQLIGQIEDELPILRNAFDEPFNVIIGANSRFLNQYLTSVSKFGTIVTMKANDTGKPFLLETNNHRMLMAGIKI